MREKPPYLPFKTFLNALDQLGSNMPNHVEKTFFDSYSGAIQGQIIGAFRFLELIDEGGLFKGDVLERLATEKSIAARKVNLRPILKSRYSDVVKLDLRKLTRSQLDAAFDDYGVSGDTKKKAKTFFIKAAKFAELEVSAQLTRRRMVAGGTKRKRSLVQPVRIERDVSQTQEIAESVMSETVKLKGGSTVTITVKGSLLKFDQDLEKVSAVMKLLRS
jgi:hypothetical protein